MSRRSSIQMFDNLASSYSKILEQRGITDRPSAMKFLDEKFPRWREYVSIIGDPSDNSKFILVGKGN